nr:hypothetical protein [Sphingomonas sp.]
MSETGLALFLGEDYRFPAAEGEGGLTDLASQLGRTPVGGDAMGGVDARLPARARPGLVRAARPAALPTMGALPLAASRMGERGSFPPA